MKTELKLGAITAAEAAAMMQAELHTLSADAPTREIGNFTDKIGEIARGTMFLIGEDNSLAEMMAAAKNGALTVLCTRAPASLERIPDTAVLVCDSIDAALARLAKAYTARGRHKTIALTGANGKTKTGEFVYSVLEEMYKVHKATDVKGGAMNDAQMLFDIPADADFFLTELKLRDKRDIARLANLIDCDVGIIIALKSEVDARANVDVLSGLKIGGELALSAEDDALSLICESGADRQYVSVRGADGALRNGGEETETCQYYMFFFGVADPETDAALWSELRTEYSGLRAERENETQMYPANAFIGKALRMLLLDRYGLKEELIAELRAVYAPMAALTGTLWENLSTVASCDHGFASYAACLLDAALRQDDPYRDLRL